VCGSALVYICLLASVPPPRCFCSCVACLPACLRQLRRQGSLRRSVRVAEQGHRQHPLRASNKGALCLLACPEGTADAPPSIRQGLQKRLQSPGCGNRTAANAEAPRRTSKQPRPVQTRGERRVWLLSTKGTHGSSKAKQSKAKQSKAKQSKARQGKAKQGKARQGNTPAHVPGVADGWLQPAPNSRRLASACQEREQRRAALSLIMVHTGSRRSPERKAATHTVRLLMLNDEDR